MVTGLTLQINGKPRSFAELGAPVRLADLLDHLELKADRIAVELNGELAPRTMWSGIVLTDGDKLEIVHFVGGGIQVFPVTLCRSSTQRSP